MVHLPAVNTPQFSWVQSRLPNRAKPVAPIYQPDVAADAIYWAAHNHRRELFVGLSTVKAIVGNKVVPGALDKYLATAAFDGQQTDEPQNPDQRFNLWEPVPGDPGAHGTFDAEARAFSPELWAAKTEPQNNRGFPSRSRGKPLPMRF